MRLSFYVARRFSAMLLLMLAGVAIIVFLAEYVEILRRFGEADGFSGLLGVRLTLMRVPIIVDGVLPFVCLFAALFHLLGLSRKLELVVARASGISVWGFLRAPIVVAALFGVIAITAINPVALDLKRRADIIEARLSGSASPGETGLWFRQSGRDRESIVHSASVQQDGLALFGVTAFVFDDQGAFQEKVTGARADLAGDRWILPDAKVLSASAAPLRVVRYELATGLTAQEVRRTLVKASTVSLWSLPGFIATADRTGRNADRLRLAFHNFLNRPLFLVAMVTIAATVSLRLTRYGGVWQLVLTGVAAGFLLYVLTEIASDLGQHGILNPVLAAWLPPIVALTFGATALLYLEDG